MFTKYKSLLFREIKREDYYSYEINDTEKKGNHRVNDV